MTIDLIWDGITKTETLDTAWNETYQALAGAAKRYDWPSVFAILSEHPERVNSSRPGGKSRYTPLHQAAHGGAPVEIIRHLVKLGAWRTLQNARGERPIDVAERIGHRQVLHELEPVYRHSIPHGVLLKIQSHFHEVIIGRAGRLISEHALRMPEIEPLLEMHEPHLWFPVPGMTGGFSYKFVTFGVNAQLVSESWIRVIDGSAQRHLIDAGGSRLVDEGFV